MWSTMGKQTAQAKEVYFPVKWAFFSVIFRNTVVATYCCGHNTCEKRVSVICTFPHDQPAQVVRWSLDFLPPNSLLLAPKRFSSFNLHLRNAFHAPCIGKLTAKCPVCSTASLDSVNTFTWTRRHLCFQRKQGRHYSSSSGYSAPRSRIAGMEIQEFRNENKSQANASSSHYSNYSYSELIPNKRAFNVLVRHSLLLSSRIKLKELFASGSVNI